MNETVEAGLEIAVIGMAGRFPGAKDIDEFWTNLKNGIESISFFSDEELKEGGSDSGSLQEQNYVKAHGMLVDIEYFDADFFGYTPTEARLMDPQIRIFHECAWTALEDAGYEPGAYEGLIGLYAGASPNLDWQARALLSGKSEEIGYFAAGHVTEKDYLSLRVSFKLNLKGPSFSLNTACSTSLAAIHLAYRAIITGECDMALAGGITLGPLKKTGYWYSEGMINSPDGHCRAFDARSKGTILGNGVGIVVLKRLEDAVWDKNHIYAVIKGAAINNDGIRKAGFTAPSVEGQAEVIKMAQQMAEVDPETINYIETHGTGTPLGDPVEIEALKLAFNTGKKGFCPIGSIKTNMGHLDTAAGVAGFIKTVLALYHKLIPPSLFFENPNPTIDFETTPFYVNTRLNPWGNKGTPLRAGVSSFGIGGTNVHIVLEEAPAASKEQRPSGGRSYRLILLSAKTQSALERMTENLAEFLKKNKDTDIADAAYTLQVGRKVFLYRRALTCGAADDALDTLSSRSPAKVKTFIAKEGERPVIFMFSGIGSQYVDMGLDLYRNEPLFREEMERCFEILNPILGYELKEVLYPGGVNKPSGPPREQPAANSAKIDQIGIAQLVIFMIEYALARLVIKWGIKPRAMIGYSFGEYAAACVSGVFSLEDALKLIVYRGQLIRQTQAGGMLSVPLPREELEPLLDNRLAIAIDNGPSCVAAGSKEILASLEKQMKEKKVLCMWVQNSHALHSKLMEPIANEFERAVSRVKLNKPQIAYISNVTGDWLKVEESTDPAYWARHLQETVRFATGIEALAKIPGAVFVEIGPGRDLNALVLRHIENKPDLKTLHLLRHPGQNVPDDYFLLSGIGRLWLWGVKIDWNEFHTRENRKRISLPTYPFQRDKYWLEPFPPDRETGKVNVNFTTGDKTGVSGWFYLPTWKRSPLTTANPRPESAVPPGCWLLFMDNHGLGVQLREKLKKENQEVITVCPGMEFRRETDCEFTVNPQPGHHSDYEALFARLGRINRVADKIVHLWGVTAAGQGKNQLNADVVEAAQNLGFSSLLSIVQVLGKNDPGKKIEITVVTDNMQDVNGDDGLCPGKATVLGLVKSINNEYTGIQCRSIDVILSKKGSSPPKEQVRQLFDELTGQCVEPVVAYRNVHRWVQSFEPFHLERSKKKNPRLREEGVYLVTGGLGGIGLLLAGHLAKTVRAKLVLTGRSAFPPRKEWQRLGGEDKEDDVVKAKIGRLKALEEAGAEVLPLQADVTDETQVRQVIHKTLEKFGRINGVIHAAGLPDGELIRRKKPGPARNLLEAKVRGTLLLDKALKEIDLDFFVLCSSMASLRAGIGQASYGAANNFLDAFARYKFYQGGVFTVSINWDRWQKVGIAVIAESMHKKLTGEELAGGISPEQGVEIFNRIINETQPQVIVSTLDPRREIERPGVLDASSLIKNIEDKDLFTSARRRPELETEYIAPGSDREQKIAAVWAKFFGFGQVGVADDFFELGGDSLKAMVVAAKIHKELNIELPFQEFFNRPTIRELVEYLDRHGKKSVYVSIETVEKKEYYPLTSAQKRLYILQQMDMNSKSYNQTNFARLEGEPDKSRFERAFRQLIRRHESLRTSFALINGAPVQVIHNGVEFEFRFHDQANGVELIPGAIIETFINPFDLSRAPLLRVGLVKMGPREYLLMVDMHHIIADGISLEILKRDFMSLYGQEELPILHLGYRDFSEWQNRRLDSGEIKKQEQYWLKEFVGEIPHLDLPGDYPRPDVQDAAGRKFKMQLSAEQTLGLKRLSKEQDVTLYMTTLAVLKVFLAILCGQESLVVGTSTAGRSHDDLQDIIGMFVNTLALKSDPAGDKRFDGFLREIKGISLAALENQEYPFEELVEKLSLSRDMSRNPLFDVMFSFQNFEAPPLEAPLSSLPAAEPAVPLKKEPYAFEELTSRFDLTLFVEETAATLLFIFEYRTTLFKPDTIERFGHYLEKTVSAILANPGVRLGTIEILAAEEKQRLLYEFNPTGVEYPVDMTVHELFARQVRQNPDRVALVGSDLQITKYNLQTNHKPIDEMQISYRELNERAVRVAGTLGEKGVRSDTLVGIMAERSPEMITGILGILKAGGAYLPIDPGYPGERIKFMLADSSAKLLLTTGNLAKESEKVRRWEGEKILLEKIFAVPKSNAYLLTLLPSYLQNSSTLAYIIYTSGTTGRPKGAAITHGNVVRLLFNDRFPFDFSEADVWTLFHSFCFDFSVWEMYGALLYGGKLVVVPAPALRDPAAYLGILRRSGVTVLNQTPSAFYHLMAEELKENFNRLRLRYVIFGGEALSPGKLEKWHEAYPGTCLVNMYGITETTVHVTYKEITAPGMRLGLSNIGKPIPTLEVYVMDQSERLSCPGAAGELWVGGAGVCRGYLNRPELTQEKFDHDLKDLWDYHDKKNRNSKKFLEVSEGAGSPSLLKFTRRVPSLTLTTNTNTLYKTGDLARWLEDSGELEYLGRIDGQVKIRGYRVELGEIQSRLLKHEQITGAVVQAGEEESGTRFLCAYYVSAHLLAVSALRDFLSRELPGYMLPSYFVRVDSIPLTVNGKVDWKSLPAPGEFQPHLKNAYAAPATEMENIIASVWQEVLQLKKIGIDDNFFEIGGHSLNILQVNARLAELSGKKYPLVAIFRYPTIRAFARFLQQQGAGEGIDIGRRAEAIKRAKEQRKQRNPKKTGNPGGQG